MCWYRESEPAFSIKMPTSPHCSSRRWRRRRRRRRARYVHNVSAHANRRRSARLSAFPSSSPCPFYQTPTASISVDPQPSTLSHRSRIQSHSHCPLPPPPFLHTTFYYRSQILYPPRAFHPSRFIAASHLDHASRSLLLYPSLFSGFHSDNWRQFQNQTHTDFLLCDFKIKCLDIGVIFVR